MQIYPDRLADELQKDLKPVFVTCDSEFILEREVRDEIVAAAKDRGIEDLDISPLSDQAVRNSNRRFPWNSVLDEVDESSLFGTRKVIELRMHAGLMNDRGVQFLTSLADKQPANLLLVRLMSFGYQDKRKSWYNNLRGSPLIPLIVAEELNYNALVQWLHKRAAGMNLTFDTDAVAKIADLCDGNMLEAKQELDKLGLLFPPGSTIFADDIRMADASNVEIRDLVNAVYSGQIPIVIKRMELLGNQRQSGARDEFRILNEVSRTLAMAHENLTGGGEDSRVSSYQKRRISRLQNVHGSRGIEQLLQECAQFNSMMLGMARGETWTQLQNLLLAIAGARLPRMEEEYQWRQIDRRVN